MGRAGRRGRLAGRALLWPVAWIGYAVAHGAVSGWYPYDFLDVGALGYATALRNLALVVLVTPAFLLVFWFVDRALPATRQRPGADDAPREPGELQPA